MAGYLGEFAYGVANVQLCDGPAVRAIDRQQAGSYRRVPVPWSGRAAIRFSREALAVQRRIRG
jgi:hypothetical protein